MAAHTQFFFIRWKPPKANEAGVLAHRFLYRFYIHDICLDRQSCRGRHILRSMPSIYGV